MEGRIDTSFTTEQRDLFASGIVADIGVNAYAVWSAIKYHADFETGEAWPGMRHLGDLVGLSKSAVGRAIETLQQARMVRVVKGHGKRRGQTYIARERMAIRFGQRVICTIIIDYVPARLRGTLKNLEEAISTGRGQEAFAEVEVIPGEGFEWDSTSMTLKGRVAASELPTHTKPSDDHFQRLGEAMLKRLPRE